MSLRKGVKVLYRTPDDMFQYRWQPQTFQKKIKPDGYKRRNYPKCDCKPGTQGEDWQVDFVYKLVVDGNNVEHHYAYVECDYVL